MPLNCRQTISSSGIGVKEVFVMETGKATRWSLCSWMTNSNHSILWNSQSFLSLCQNVNLSRRTRRVTTVTRKYGNPPLIVPLHHNPSVLLECKRSHANVASHQPRRSLNSHFVVTSSPYLFLSPTLDVARSFFSAAASQRVLKTDLNLMLNPSVFYVPNLLVSRSLSTDEEESVSAVAALAAAVAKPTTPERSLVPA